MFLSVIFSIILLAAGACRRAPAAISELPDFHLSAVVNARAAPLSRADLLGRPWIADFIYTRCAGPCPLLSARMSALQKKLPPAIRLVSFTVDPDHDAPAVLTEYAARFHADFRRWIFVTGEKSALARLFRDGFRIAVAESASAPIGQNIAHSTKFVLVDAAGRVRGYYDGNDPASLSRLVSDASAL